MIKKYFAVSLVTASVLLAGCSSSDDDDDKKPAPVVTDPTNPVDPANPVDVADPPETLGVGDSIMDKIRADDDLSTLVSAIEAAELNNLLDNEAKTFTLFAPVNAAFTEAFGDDLTATLADKPSLTNGLTYHVVPDQALDAAGVGGLAGTSITTAQGGTIAVTVAEDGAVMLNGSSTVIDSTQAGVSVVNKVTAVLDAPAPTTPDPGMTDPDPTTTNPPVTSSSAAQTVVVARGDSGNFSNGFNTNIGWPAVDTNTWTVFVPTDTVFDGTAAAAAYQNYVVVNGGKLSIADMTASGEVATNGGKTYPVTGDGTGPIMVGGHTITLIDDSGTSAIYSIDGLLE